MQEFRKRNSEIGSRIIATHIAVSIGIAELYELDWIIYTSLEPDALRREY